MIKRWIVIFGWYFFWGLEFKWWCFVTSLFHFFLQIKRVVLCFLDLWVGGRAWLGACSFVKGNSMVFGVCLGLEFYEILATCLWRGSWILWEVCVERLNESHLWFVSAAGVDLARLVVWNLYARWLEGSIDLVLLDTLPGIHGKDLSINLLNWRFCTGIL
jgi:hypothetical protein